MNVTTQEFTDWKSKVAKVDFVHLKDITFAEYNFIYNIKDGDNISLFSQIKHKHQLLFQRIDSNVKQMNLMLIDSAFSTLLSDVVFDVLCENVSSFEGYRDKEKERTHINIVFYNEYLKYKFYSFIHLLIYSNIATTNVCNGIIETNRVYYFKNRKNDIEYYSIYEQNELQLLLINKMKLEIDFEKSFIKEKEASICLRIFL